MSDGEHARAALTGSPSDLPCSVEIRPHARSRRLKLSYRADRGFLLSHPARTSQRSIHEFLVSHRDWMQQVLARSQTAHPSTSGLRDYLSEFPVLYLGTLAKPVRFGAASGLLEVRDREVVIFEAISESQLFRRLWQLAAWHLSQRLLNVSVEVGLAGQLGRVQIRDQRSRWGSCSRGCNISLNWRLILMPTPLQRHILLHELAHIPHPDHSAAFWNCLGRWDPDTPAHRAMLRRQGTRWMRLGRSLS